MDCRVTVVEGDAPILLVAPHGFDDPYTAEITEEMASVLDCYAVINWGWERDDTVDFLNDKANCNNIKHCHEDVVKDEFLDPIFKYINRIETSYDEVNVFTIHGMSNLVKKQSGIKNLDMIIGYGAGGSSSCPAWKRKAFLYVLHKSGFFPCKGKAGGRFAGAGKNNLNQLYRKWYNDKTVDSMQIEIIRELRQDVQMAKETAQDLAGIIDEYLTFLDADGLPKSYDTQWEEIVKKEIPSF